MDWIYLGHAMWLCQVGDLRILFDPLLMPTHHSGVFEVVPQREIHAGALKPDFIVVSHRHPDHFDVPSLATLAKYDRDAVVLTSDELIVATAKQLGFRTVAQLDDHQTVDLEGARLFTTPSYSAQVEWGVIVEAAGCIVWNQVDTVHRDAHDVVKTLDQASTALGRDCRRPNLVLAQWAPLLEVAAVTAGRIGFPVDGYRRVIECTRATNAEMLVPASAGTQHVGPSAWLNALVHPLSLTQFVKEAASVLPDGKVHGITTGSLLRVGERAQSGDGSEKHAPPTTKKIATTDSVGLYGPRDWPFMRRQPAHDQRRFCPTHIPALGDPIDENDSATAHLQRSIGWVEDVLTPALLDWHGRSGNDGVFVLEVVGAARRQSWTFRLTRSELSIHVGQHDDYDVYNGVAASRLCGVIDGQFGWGDVLLGGFLRVVVRRARIVDGEPTHAAFPPVFLYEALGYDESRERAVRLETERLIGEATP